MTDIEKIRLYINDKAGTKFTDAELQMFLDETGCVFCAVAEAWSIIATQSNISGTKKYSVGTETYEKAGADDQVKAALRNADYFKGKCTCSDTSFNSSSSFMLKSGVIL